MSIYIPESPEDIFLKIKRHITLPRPDWALDSIKVLRSQILKKDYSDLSPVILTGHQPIFYHPGILAKDLLSHSLAGATNATALNMIVDTDEEDISLQLPVRGRNGILVKETFPLSSRGIALVGQKISDEKKNRILNRLHEYKKELYQVFLPTLVPQIRNNVDILQEIVLSSEDVCEPGIRLREMWEKENSIRLKTIYTSEIIKTEAFLIFKEYIFKRESEFRKIYNESLHDYRKIHKIKNKAQPLPDLDEISGELPFWYVRNGERMPFMRGNKIEDKNIYPRAVSLTLFCRIFLADLMIHGIGGARYDQITNRLLERFFKYEAAPFSVASATLSLDVRSDYPIDSRKISDIEKDLRTYEFDPTHFMPDTDPLMIQKKEIIQSRTIPGADLKKCHKEIQLINKKAKDLLTGVYEDLIKEKKREKIVSKNNLIRLDRTFPFIFYNIAPLIESIKCYGQMANEKKKSIKV
jgi:hypothetical protein